MKLTTAFLSLMTMAASSAASTFKSGTISSKAAQKLVRRRLDQGDDQNAEEEEFAFLGNYNLKVVGCNSKLDQAIMTEDGEYEYAAVLLRLCPAADGCDSTSDSGCDSGYGDMLVGMSTFVEAYFEDQKENEEEEGDDAFEVDRFSKCEEYNPDEYNDDDANQGAWENYAFYVGPTCTEDQLGLKLELFTDEYCTTVSETPFETISNGWTLPYSSGGLVSTYCQSCSTYNDDGEAEIREMCEESYENAAYKCEEGMESYSYYGQNNQGCELLEEMFPKSTSNGGKVFGWIVLAVVAVGLVGYIVWWRSKKATSIES